MILVAWYWIYFIVKSEVGIIDTSSNISLLSLGLTLKEKKKNTAHVTKLLLFNFTPIST